MASVKKTARSAKAKQTKRSGTAKAKSSKRLSAAKAKSAAARAAAKRLASGRSSRGSGARTSAARAPARRTGRKKASAGAASAASPRAGKTAQAKAETRAAAPARRSAKPASSAVKVKKATGKTAAPKGAAAEAKLSQAAPQPQAAVRQSGAMAEAKPAITGAATLEKTGSAPQSEAVAPARDPQKQAVEKNLREETVLVEERNSQTVQDQGGSIPSPRHGSNPRQAFSTAALKAGHDAASTGRPAAAAGPVPPAKANSVPKPPAAEVKGNAKAAAPGQKTPKVSSGPRQAFAVNEFVVYPAHGVGQIVAIEEQEVAGFRLELYVLSFIKDKMILKVPTAKAVSAGMRKIADTVTVKAALNTLAGRARIKRAMWSRRAQEYEAKINSGDLNAIAEVVRDLYRSETQPEQSYSERQLYEAALDRLSREIVVVQDLTETESLKMIEAHLQKGPRRKKDEAGEAEAAESAEPVADEADIEEAA